MTKRKRVPSLQQPSTPPRQRGKGRIWPQHKLEAVLEHLRGEKSVAEICQARGISQSTFFAWKDHVVAGALEYLTHGGVSAGERQAREQVRQLEKALARETLHKQIAQEALSLVKDPSWRKRVGSSA